VHERIRFSEIFCKIELRLTTTRKWLTDHHRLQQPFQFVFLHRRIRRRRRHTSWAHEQDQAASALLDVRRYKKTARSTAIESGLEDVITTVEHLRIRSIRCHRPIDESVGRGTMPSATTLGRHECRGHGYRQRCVSSLFGLGDRSSRAFGSTVPIAVRTSDRMSPTNTAARQMRLLDQVDDLQFLAGWVSHSPSSPARSCFF